MKDFESVESIRKRKLRRERQVKAAFKSMEAEFRAMTPEQQKEALRLQDLAFESLNHGPI